MTVTRVIARPLLASMFIVGGVSTLKNASSAAGRARPVTDKVVPALKKAAPGLPIPEDAATLVRLNAALHVGAGAALATGHLPRVSATLLAASLLPTTATHQFWNESDPTQRANQKIHFLKNVSMLGGLMLAAVDTDGRPGLLWRARHASRDVRREARHLSATARREAKLAAAQLG